MPRLSLPLAGEERQIPVYTGHLDGRLQDDLWTVGRNGLAAKIFPVSYPNKLDCPAWGISAARCRMGSVLGQKENSVCHESNCYAKRGTFRFAPVQRKLEEAYEGMFHPLWVPAGIHMVRWTAKDLFRLFHSGDVQSQEHMENILTICNHVRDCVFWMPSREKAIILKFRERIRETLNLTVRASATTVDGPPPTWWHTTSTVVSSEEPGDNVCPSWEQEGRCDGCRACASRDVPNVIYRRT